MVQLAKLSGASRVILSEPVALRQEIGLSVGADWAVDPVHESLTRSAGIEWTGKKSYWLEEGEKVGDSRADNCQQQEMEGKLQFYSHLTLMECTLASLKVSNLNFLGTGQFLTHWNPGQKQEVGTVILIL